MISAEEYIKLISKKYKDLDKIKNEITENFNKTWQLDIYKNNEKILHESKAYYSDNSIIYKLEVEDLEKSSEYIYLIEKIIESIISKYGYIIYKHIMEESLGDILL